MSSPKVLNFAQWFLKVYSHQNAQLDSHQNALDLGKEGCDTNTAELFPNFEKYVLKGTSKTAGVTASDSFDAGIALHPVGSKERQVKAIRLYSGNRVYAGMNKALREDSPTGLAHYGLLIKETVQPFAFASMQQNQSVLKPFLGTVWRGMQLSAEDQAKYQEQHLLTWRAFSSTSSAKGCNFSGNTICEIHCNKTLEALNGSDDATTSDLFVPAGIQAFSHYPNESEVLFPPYTKFRVVHRKQQGHTLFLTLETVEFPSLHLLIEKGDWNGVKEILSSQAQAAEKTGEQPWMVQQASAGHQIFQQMAQKIVVEGAGSPGLQAFSQLLGMGAEPASAVDTLMWVEYQTGQRSDHNELQAVHHCHLLVHNNIGREVRYVVGIRHQGGSVSIVQKPLSGYGMVGNERKVWRQ